MAKPGWRQQEDDAHRRIQRNRQKDGSRVVGQHDKRLRKGQADPISTARVLPGQQSRQEKQDARHLQREQRVHARFLGKLDVKGRYRQDADRNCRRRPVQQTPPRDVKQRHRERREERRQRPYRPLQLAEQLDPEMQQTVVQRRMLVDADQPLPTLPQTVAGDPNAESLIQPDTLPADPVEAQNARRQCDRAHKDQFVPIRLHSCYQACSAFCTHQPHYGIDLARHQLRRAAPAGGHALVSTGRSRHACPRARPPGDRRHEIPV